MVRAVVVTGRANHPLHTQARSRRPSKTQCRSPCRGERWTLSDGMQQSMTTSADPYRPPLGEESQHSTSRLTSLLYIAGLIFGGFWCVVAALFVAYMISLPILHPGFSDPSVSYSHWPWLNFVYSGFFGSIAALLGLPLVVFVIRRRRRLAASDDEE